MSQCTCGNCGAVVASPSGAPGASPYNFANFNTLSVPVNTTGDLVNTVFPVLRRVASLNFNTNAGLIALTLSSSLTNPVAGQAGFFVALDRGADLSVQGLDKLFLSHLTNQNSLPGVPNPSSRSNALQMGQQTFFKVDSGQKLALYACSPNDATVLLSAVLTALWIPVGG